MADGPDARPEEEQTWRPYGHAGWFLLAYVRAMWRHRAELLALAGLILGLTLLAAAAMYGVEREAETFETFWDAFYWAAITVTTVGYGDITPATRPGQVIAVLTSFFGAGFLLVAAGLVAVFFARAMER